MSWIPYRTADWIPGSPAFWLRISGLHAARELTAIGVGIFVAAWVLIGVGQAFGVMVANTDSAAPAGVYRVASASFRRGDLVAACLPGCDRARGARARLPAHRTVRGQCRAGRQGRGRPARRHRRD